jgi:hypothetical protein
VAKKNELFESWSIDYPLEEFTMEMVNYPLVDETIAPKHSSDANPPSNGKPEASDSKPRKKKPTPRRKA